MTSVAVAYLAGPLKAGPVFNVLGFSAVIAIVVVVLLVRRQAGQLADRAEEAYPGPLDEFPRRPEHPDQQGPAGRGIPPGTRRYS